MLLLAHRLRKLGYSVDVYGWQDYKHAKAALETHSRAGELVIVVGYSLGGGTATALGLNTWIDLLIALDPSVLGYNYKINKKFVHRAVLWHDSDWLLNGPIGHAGLDLGFDKVNETQSAHLLVDLTTQSGVIKEIDALI